MFRILILLFLMAASANVFSQELATGFYLLMSEKTRNCATVITTINGKQSFCVTKQPILAQKEFESVSDIKFAPDKKSKFVDLKVTVAGTTVLSSVMTKLPESKLLLVVNSKVVGVFNNTEINSITGRIIRINGEASSPEIEWIYEKLKSAKN